jgi:CheY-like chemotaxis protein
MHATPQDISPLDDQLSGADNQEIRLQLARILNSEVFAKSPQLSRFLKHCVEQTLKGQQDYLKEQLLGTEVFRRVPFDPRLDPIVRVEARRLRAKLDEYYAGEGARDSIVISFQRGDYIPRFVHVSGGADRRAKPEKPATIVIVEDERVVAKDLENRLRSLGYSVVGSAPSGEAAVECIDNFHPDIVLMDIVLAGSMRGTEAAQLIWNRWRIPVVYLTAFSDAVVLEEIKGSEPYGYILKPFEPKQVHAVLQLALSRRAKEIAANGGLTPERARRQALISRLENTPTRTWQWIIKDERVPWPESAECHPNPTLSGHHVSADEFLDQVSPEDRDRVTTAFNEGIRRRERIEIVYRKKDDSGGDSSLIAVGCATQNNERRLQVSGIEISAPAEAHESDLTRIEGGVDQVHSLVMDLATYASLSHQQPTSQEFVDLDLALEAALANLQPAIRDSGTRITRCSLSSVLASRVHMVQLFEKLIANAIQYTAKRGEPSITISARNVGSRWRITVRDEGSGLSPENAESIFEPFTRPHGSAVPGTGFGLAICRRIVELYGGRIWAESQPGKGASFHFTLPGVPELSSSSTPIV